MFAIAIFDYDAQRRELKNKIKNNDKILKNEIKTIQLVWM